MGVFGRRVNQSNLYSHQYNTSDNIKEYQGDKVNSIIITDIQLMFQSDIFQIHVPFLRPAAQAATRPPLDSDDDDHDTQAR